MIDAQLEGKVAIVTGGGRGLGLAIASALANNGASVVIASRDGDRCAAVAGELAATTGQKVVGISCHVGQWKDCDRLVAQACEMFGDVDVLVNNAGMSPAYPSLVDVSEELFDKVIAVNLKGPFRLSALIGTRMQQSRGGSIINISSIAAVTGPAEAAPYGAAKAGLNNLTTSLSRSFGPTVRVNAIMAGLFRTDMSRSWNRERSLEAKHGEVPPERSGLAREIVGAALYLASDALSSYTNGAVIKVDGGIAHPHG